MVRPIPIVIGAVVAVMLGSGIGAALVRSDDDATAATASTTTLARVTTTRATTPATTSPAPTTSRPTLTRAAATRALCRDIRRPSAR